MSFEQIKQETRVFFYPDTRTERQYGAGVLDKTGKSRDLTDFRMEHYTLVCVLRGSGRYSDELGCEKDLSAGMFFQRQPGFRHTTVIDPDSRWLECYLTLGWNAWQLCRELGVIPAVSVGKCPSSPECTAADFQTLIQSIPVRQYGGMETETVWRMIEFLRGYFTCLEENETDPYARFVKSAVRRMEKDFSVPFRAAAFCAEQHCNYHSFRRKFRELRGLPPEGFRQELRLSEAVRLLTATDLRINEIAARLGYATAFDFSRRFRDRFAIPPRSYRQLHGDAKKWWRWRKSNPRADEIQ